MISRDEIVKRFCSMMKGCCGCNHPDKPCWKMLDHIENLISKAENEERERVVGEVRGWSKKYGDLPHHVLLNKFLDTLSDLKPVEEIKIHFGVYSSESQDKPELPKEVDEHFDNYPRRLHNAVNDTIQYLKFIQPLLKQFEELSDTVKQHERWLREQKPTK